MSLDIQERKKYKELQITYSKVNKVLVKWLSLKLEEAKQENDKAKMGWLREVISNLKFYKHGPLLKQVAALNDDNVFQEKDYLSIFHDIVTLI